jgi:hypothetical protein
MWIFVLCGCAGGLLPDVLRLVNSRYDARSLPYLRSKRFWISLAMLVPLGGLAAWLFDSRTPLQAVAFGYAAPEMFSRILSREAGQQGNATVKKAESAPYAPTHVNFESIRHWWAH